MKDKWESIKRVLDDTNVYYQIEKVFGFVEFWTNFEGQDIPIEFDYDGTPKDFVKQFIEYAENYDVDEEVEIFFPLRGQWGIPRRIMDIIKDCQEAKDMQMEISSNLSKVI